MKNLNFLDFSKKDIHFYIILLSAPVLLTIYRYHGFPDTFDTNSYSGSASDTVQRIIQFAVFFFLTFLIPFLYAVFVMKVKLSDLGFGAGNFKQGLRFLIFIPVLVLPAIYFAAKMPDVQSEYPLAKSLMTDQTHLIVYQFAYIILYYIAWEFYFRGFLLFGLKDRFGVVNAILIQTISSCLIHIGKPEGEIVGSIIIGIIFGVIAIKTRSIWYVFLIHASIGVLLDLFIIYGK